MTAEIELDSLTAEGIEDAVREVLAWARAEGIRWSAKGEAKVRATLEAMRGLVYAPDAGGLCLAVEDENAPESGWAKLVPINDLPKQ